MNSVLHRRPSNPTILARYQQVTCCIRCYALFFYRAFQGHGFEHKLSAGRPARACQFLIRNYTGDDCRTPASGALIRLNVLMILSNPYCIWRRSKGAAFCLLLSLSVSGMAHAATADDYPARAIRLISPFTPGGGNDIVARSIAATLTKNMGQSVVVDNRPGANSIVGMELVVKAVADGYTMIMGSSALAVNATLYSKLPFDTVKDFAPVSLAASTPFILAVHPSLPVTTVKHLIALAKAKPRELHFPSSGTGNATHLAGELFNAMAGVTLVHVPYKGTAPGLNDLIAGRLSLVFNAPGSVLPHIISRRLRAIAVTSSARSSVMPELPTVSEAGLPGYEASTWHGVLAPGKTPRPIVVLTSAEIIKALSNADVKERFANLGMDPIGNTPEQFAAYIQAEIVRWAKVIKTSGVKPE